MNKSIKKIFTVDKKPTKGLFSFEWAMLAYLLLTLVITLFCYTDLVNPGEMISGRIRAVVITLVVWGVYRLWPCRAMVALRVTAQAALLAWWYTDTYEFNRILPNLDHVFASLDQSLFGCQLSLLFSEHCPWFLFSEAMYFGYYSYFYLVAIIVLLYFFYRYDEFPKAAAVVLGSFFIYYVVFDFLPVTGPQFYYQAIGLDNVNNGIFPDVGYYFKMHNEAIPPVGDGSGIFHSLVESGTVRAGERPTAAFPSSHVGVTTVMACLLIRLCYYRHDWRIMYVFAPIFVLLCLATVYIHAHYVVDTLAGFISGLVLYFILWKAIRK